MSDLTFVENYVMMCVKVGVGDMCEKYLVINSGSSSVKFTLYAMPGEGIVAKGSVERIGKAGCNWTIKYDGKKVVGNADLGSHVEAVKVIMRELLQRGILNDISEIKGIGHRVLHGASLYNDSALITEKVLDDIEALTPLGPLHHPGEIAGIKCMMELLPGVPNVAVFDTAFHQTMPEENYMYAVPYKWYKKYGVRRYGFHGTSHKYITEFMKEILGKDNVNIISCHIGSGASIAAIKDGKCIDTSMGLTPLDGLMMGTRSGSVDPSIIEYVKRQTNMKVAEINRELNEESGLLGIAGKNDWRDIENLAASGDERAQLAVKMFVKKIVEFVSDYYFELDGKLDGIIFTAGIGENSSSFRKLVVDKIKGATGITLNEEENDKIAGFKEKSAGIISGRDSKINVYVIPTDEEKMIMLDTYEIVKENELNNVRSR